MSGGTRSRKNSFFVNTDYIAGKLLDTTGLSDGDGFAYDLATDKFVPVPLTATGDIFAANNLSDIADAATALANLGGEPAIGAKGTAFNKNFGTTAGTVTEGNHNHDSTYAAAAHDHLGTYEAANANIQQHIAETSNPHGVTLLQLGDFPSAFVADKWMKVNATADGIEFVDAPTGGGGTWGSITGTLADQTDLQNALNAKAASDHNHTGTYEAANENIQSHISDVNKHIDWTGTNKNLNTSGYIRISVAGSAHFTLEGNSTSRKTIYFVGPDALGNISFGASSPNMDFNVGLERPLRLLPTGEVQMPEYGSFNHTAETNAIAGWDAVGKMVELTNVNWALVGNRPNTLSGYGIVDALSITNTAEYTPTQDYHPATKKYVDDNAGSGSGASVAIEDTAPVGTESLWYQPTKGVFSLLVDGQWVDVGRNGKDGEDGAPGQAGAGMAFISIILSKSATINQNVGGANGTEVWWTWDGETRKDAEFTHDNSTNSERISITNSGWYKITFRGNAEQTGVGRATLYGIFRINGGSTQGIGTIRNYSRGAAYGNMSPGLDCTIQLTAGDYIEIGTRVEDTDAVYTINTTSGGVTAPETHLSITRLE